jgi:ribokinase
VSKESAENSILLFPGTNHGLTEFQIKDTFSQVEEGDFILLQNEISLEMGALAIQEAKSRNALVAWNPAPCSREVLDAFDLSKIDILFLNEIEAQMMAHFLDPPLKNVSEMDIAKSLMHSLGNVSILILTLGSRGGVLLVRTDQETLFEHLFEAERGIDPVDTTGAGDCFVGYFMGALSQMIPMNKIGPSKSLWTAEKIESFIFPCLRLAVHASGKCCEELGAIPKNKVDCSEYIY